MESDYGFDNIPGVDKKSKPICANGANILLLEIMEFQYAIGSVIERMTGSARNYSSTSSASEGWFDPEYFWVSNIHIISLQYVSSQESLTP
jgi:hypothetical protein